MWEARQALTVYDRVKFDIFLAVWILSWWGLAPGAVVTVWSVNLFIVLPDTFCVYKLDVWDYGRSVMQFDGFCPIASCTDPCNKHYSSPKNKVWIFNKEFLVSMICLPMAIALCVHSQLHPQTEWSGQVCKPVIHCSSKEKLIEPKY